MRVVEHVTVVPADELAAWLARLGDVLVGGDGAVLYARPAAGHGARRAEAIPAPTAAMVGRAVACGAPGLVFGPDAVLPLYGRAPTRLAGPAPGSRRLLRRRA